ncbi:hypothetical protein [Hydrogenophaga sp.]|uniref:hypothetical protein n=1 Tax=Hydrogenophaga sp. TaxID=1904254 RepID=UPI0025C48AC6|nr:hypothetical protein [Hydrogenophaga sp.]
MSNVIGHPQPDRNERATQTQSIRTAAHSAPQRGQARTSTNGEELAYGDSYAGNFHKGLPHGPTGFVDLTAYREYNDTLLQQDHARFEGLPVGANFPAAVPDPALRTALAELQAKIPASILSAIAAKNTADTSGAPTASAGILAPNGNTGDLPAITAGKNYLRPMASPEGSPTHPAYGAGHATVAGACVTALKAFFEMYLADGVTELPWQLTAGQGPGGSGAYGFGKVYVGNKAVLNKAAGSPALTVQGELDKLAANIAIARNVAGVHYYTDFFASLRMGERITVSILDGAGHAVRRTHVDELHQLRR